MIEGISDQARLLRGFATDFLTSHDVSVVGDIMHPEYSLSISSHLFDGRDNHYLPATQAQLEQFPGLVVTVHDTLICETHVAMRFTEHGVSQRDEGRAASWGGISLFEIECGKLRHGWAEEDYYARKEQLASGRVNPVEMPAPAPWDGPCHSPDVQTTKIAERWLKTPEFLADEVIVEIGVGEPRLRTIIDVAKVEMEVLFAGGGRAAFHLRLLGTYQGGFESVDSSVIGTPLTLPVAGILTVTNGAVSEAQICADRLGAFRTLRRRTI